MDTARGCLEEGNLTGAFELSQDASQLLMQVSGRERKWWGKIIISGM